MAQKPPRDFLDVIVDGLFPGLADPVPQQRRPTQTARGTQAVQVSVQPSAVGESVKPPPPPANHWPMLIFAAGAILIAIICYMVVQMIAFWVFLGLFAFFSVRWYGFWRRARNWRIWQLMS